MSQPIRTIVILFIGIALGRWAASRDRHPAQPPEPGEQAAPVRGELWLADFESPEDIAKHWKSRSVIATVSEEHAAHGRFAAKVTYQPAEAPAFYLEDRLSSDRRRRDWRGYDILSFDLYNPQPSQERLILQLKDRDGRVYKEDIFLNGKSSQRISVRLQDLKDYLDLSRMAQFDLFRWKPRKAGTFYLDAVRLQPVSRQAGAEIASPLPSVAPQAQWSVAWSSALTKLPRDPAKFVGSVSRPVHLSLAKLEYESVQLALIGGSQPTRIRVSVGALTHTDGRTTFPNDVIEIRQVGYVSTVQPYYPVSYVGEWPDPLPPAGEVEVPAGMVQPVWITIGAPELLPAGRYEGTVTLTDSEGRTERVALQVTVRTFVLPRTSHLKTAFDFYRFRLEKAYREFVQGGAMWEGRMGELERLYTLDMIKHRVSPILGIDPTDPAFGRDIDWYLRLGLRVFGIGSHGGSHGNNWPDEPAELDRVMAWYGAAARSLRSQRLLDAAYVYTYDEPSPGDPRVAEIMERVHAADPGLKNLLVMHEAPDPSLHAEWLRHVDILCIRLASYDPEHARRFEALGKEVWVYVSSPSHPFPALVIDYPAMAHRILPWMCWKYGAKGLLYWCVNFWNGDPWADPANYTADQNGNGSLYYPSAEGPIPSIRMEVLRDGLEDYEYLVRLRDLLESLEARRAVEPALAERARRLLAVDDALLDSLRSYSKDPDVLLAQRSAVAEMIETLEALQPGEGR